MIGKRRDIVTASAAFLALHSLSVPSRALTPGVAMASDQIKERRYYLDGPYGHIHVRDAAPVKAPRRYPLVCFHQSPISGLQYLLFQRALAPTRRVLCPDTPGFGGSDRPPFVPKIADYARALGEGLAALGFGPKKKIDVLGFHTGTLIAVELAATRPDLVRRVVLSSLALFTPEELARNRAGCGGPRPVFNDPGYVSRYFEQQVTNGLPGMLPERRLELFVERLRSGPLSWYGPEAVFEYDTATQVGKITQPTLLLVMRDTLSENTRRAGTIIRRSQIVERMDIHGPEGWDSRPDEIAKEVRIFLDQSSL